MTESLAPGHVLSHYRVLSHLGSGGMGEVYLAEDQRLGRKLALKVLSARAVAHDDRLRRFEQEARTVSALNHPNILTIYDIGQAEGRHFIATEFIDGETIRAMLGRGPFDPPAACDAARQVCAALAAAHAAGVVHRDVKPENVMRRRDGYVKVLDFGVAKLVETELGESVSDAATHMPTGTTPGVILGTFSYMSPEQARGFVVDARSDVFAVGVLVYEMIAGHSPFGGGTAADILAALIHKEPPSLADAAGASAALDRVVMRALCKEREARYQTIIELADDLSAALLHREVESESSAPVGARAPRPRAPRLRRRAVDSLAVLPLANATQDTELEYLSEGLTESLINSLSHIPRLRVMARSTVYRFKGGDGDPLQIGRELNVRAVLTGRVAQFGETLRIVVELVDVNDGSRLWGRQFNGQFSDVVRIQDDIFREMTETLRLRLTHVDRKRQHRPYTPSAAAYELYLKGRYFWNQRAPEALARAVSFFQQAIAEDPGFALAHVGLADSYALMAAGYSAIPAGNTIDTARASALHALELDETLAEAHAALAYIRFRFDWDWTGAELEFGRALELNPGHAPSRQRYAMFLAALGRFDEALAEIARARDLDPLSLAAQSSEGRILHFAGRYDEAVARYRRILQTDPRFAATRLDLSLTLIAKGAYADASAELDRAAEIIGSTATVVLLKGYCAAHEGRLDEARGACAELEARHARGTASADELAAAAFMVGDGDRACKLLQEAIQQRAPILAYMNVEPVFRGLRDDPRCRKLLRSHHLIPGE